MLVAGLVITVAGTKGTTTGYIDGSGTNALFSQPASIFIDTAANLYIVDSTGLTV
jgi:hypothetical protein